MPSIHFSLSNELKQHVDNRCQTSGYATISEHLRDLIRDDILNPEPPSSLGAKFSKPEMSYLDHLWTTNHVSDGEYATPEQTLTRAKEMLRHR